jgi:UDP-N-acetylmuramyl pentapeptide phosphotransferase/UDP-N-acetylglucosamine-1-phosphate transferase
MPSSANFETLKREFQPLHARYKRGYIDWWGIAVVVSLMIASVTISLVYAGNMTVCVSMLIVLSILLLLLINYLHKCRAKKKLLEKSLIAAQFLSAADQDHDYLVSRAAQITMDVGKVRSVLSGWLEALF